IHRCSVIYLFDEKGNVYLQKHKKSGNRLDHSVGGHVKSGETYLGAAKRELQEELGLSVELQEVCAHFLSRERSAVHMYSVFKAVASSTWKFKPNEEVEEVILTTLDHLAYMVNNKDPNLTSGLINTAPLILL
ncbi:MAG: NUDIX hydrolase, partial [Candidatus Saccharibacteria bacterium]|nr:NUDIX hydrolase [Candidatus Saccharibacteria bacterium]